MRVLWLTPNTQAESSENTFPAMEYSPIIAYPSNQKPAEAEHLRVDKHFRAHGPEGLKRLYAYKAPAERAISRLKQHLS